MMIVHTLQHLVRCDRAPFAILLLTSMLLIAGAPAGATDRVDELLSEAHGLDADMARGRTLYAQYCVSCHGRRGEGNAKRHIPIIAWQRQAYVVKQFADIREQERLAPPMHGIMKQPELHDVQAWVDVALYANNLAPVSKPQTGSGKHVSLGEATFQQHCTSCHGADARGDEDGFVPSIRNQHYSYLRSELKDLRDEHRTNVDPEFIRLLSSFDQSEQEGLADYLARMSGKTRDLTWLRGNGAAGD